MKTAVTQMTPDERAEYRAFLEAKEVKTDRDLRHLERIYRLGGSDVSRQPRIQSDPKPTKVKPPRSLRPPSPPGRASREPMPLPMDGMCRVVIDKTSNGLISWFLMASYTYHIHNVALISDDLYDTLARRIRAEWETLDHRHKALITIEDLRAGSMYRTAPAEYPVTVRSAAASLLAATAHPIDPELGV